MLGYKFILCKYMGRGINSIAEMTIVTLKTFLYHIKRKVIGFITRIIDFLSFGFIRIKTQSSESSTNFRSKNRHNNSMDCLSSSSNSSDSELDNLNNEKLKSNISFRGGSARLADQKNQLIAHEAVAHSYEDITQPDYRNHLWMSSQWDRTDLFSAFYFLLNWAEKFNDEKEVELEKDSNSNFKRALFVLLGKTNICQPFLNFIYNLTSLPDSFFPRKRISVPKRHKTLILDLDETLIHSTAASCSNFDFMVEVLVNRASCLYYVYKRPNLDHFLSVASNWYNLIIYTASVREYADPVIDLIDENRRYFKKRLFRSECTQTPSSHYLKDLSLIEPDISKVCLLDNSAASFAFYPDNAIPIESWKENSRDTALLDLLPFLDALRFVDDVRSILSLRRLILFFNK